MYADQKIHVFQPYLSCQQYLTVLLFVPSWPLSLVIFLVSLILPHCSGSQLLTLTLLAFSWPISSITRFKELSEINSFLSILFAIALVQVFIVSLEYRCGLPVLLSLVPTPPPATHLPHQHQHTYLLQIIDVNGLLPYLKISSGSPYSSNQILQYVLKAGHTASICFSNVISSTSLVINNTLMTHTCSLQYIPYTSIPLCQSTSCFLKFLAQNDHCSSSLWVKPNSSSLIS